MSFEEQIMSKDQISEHVFTLNGGYYYLCNLFRNKRSLSNGYSPVLAGAYSVMSGAHN